MFMEMQIIFDITTSYALLRNIYVSRSNLLKSIYSINTLTIKYEFMLNWFSKFQHFLSILLHKLEKYSRLGPQLLSI